MATTDRTIRVGTTDVTIRTSNRTTLGRTVTQNGNVIVHGPPTTTDADATDLVTRRCSWIYRQLAHLAKTAPEDPLKELVPGTGFDVLGRRHRLRIVPDSNQNEPLIQLRSAPTGSWLHMRRSTALKSDEARRTLINFYADSGREWLEASLPQIAVNTTNRNLAATFSTHHLDPPPHKPRTHPPLSHSPTPPPPPPRTHPPHPQPPHHRQHPRPQQRAPHTLARPPHTPRKHPPPNPLHIDNLRPLPRLLHLTRHIPRRPMRHRTLRPHRPPAHPLPPRQHLQHHLDRPNTQPSRVHRVRLLLPPRPRRLRTLQRQQPRRHARPQPHIPRMPLGPRSAAHDPPTRHVATPRLTRPAP
ncbi:YgjP-like metallopeptidase domain-containing protein [Streptomyces sp. x-19]|uniref:YgjP-like metallopeptidase domain-containing protein n=1 Tax=Streptomyces sp. x-19 TaxID=2789280 RepID=UPI00397FF60C